MKENNLNRIKALSIEEYLYKRSQLKEEDPREYYTRERREESRVLPLVSELFS